LLQQPLFLLQFSFIRLHAELSEFPAHELSRLIFLALNGPPSLGVLTLAEVSMPTQPFLALLTLSSVVLQALFITIFVFHTHALTLFQAITNLWLHDL